MKHSLLFFFLFAIIAAGFAQANDDDAFFRNMYDKKWIRENKIDSVIIAIDLPDDSIRRVYRFNISGDLVYAGTIDNAGHKTSESVLRYNSQGQLISRKDIEGKIDDSTTYFYSAKGVLEKAVIMNKDREMITVTYHYHEGKLVEEIRQEKTGRLVSKYNYDNYGRVTDLTVLSAQGTDTQGVVVKRKKMFYDNKGNKSLEEVTFFLKDSVRYHYDEFNRLVLVQNEKDTAKYTYDAQGFLIQKQVVRYILDSPLMYSEKYRYAVRH